MSPLQNQLRKLQGGDAPAVTLNVPSGRDRLAKQTIDLVRSPMCKRRATLKLALAEASNLHNKLSAFAAALPGRKEHVDSNSSSDSESTPSNRSSARNKAMLNLVPMGSSDEGKRASATKPKTKASTFQRAEEVKKILAFPMDSEKLGVSNKDRIVESDAENNQSPKKLRRKVFAPMFESIEKLKRNETLLKYMTTRLAKVSEGGASPTSPAGMTTSATSKPSATTTPSVKHKKVCSTINYRNQLKDYVGAMLPPLGKKTHAMRNQRQLTMNMKSTAWSAKKSDPEPKKRRIKVKKAFSFVRGIYGRLSTADALHV